MSWSSEQTLISVGGDTRMWRSSRQTVWVGEARGRTRPQVAQPDAYHVRRSPVRWVGGGSKAKCKRIDSCRSLGAATSEVRPATHPSQFGALCRATPVRFSPCLASRSSSPVAELGHIDWAHILWAPGWAVSGGRGYGTPNPGPCSSTLGAALRSN